jgi:hypothetical protein
VWGVDPGSPDGDKTAAVVREGKELRMATTEEWWRLRALI